MSSISDFLFGTKGQIGQAPTITGGQSDFLNQFLDMLRGQGGAAGGALQDMLGGGAGAAGDVEQRRFKEQTIPGIAETFTGAGGQRSSAFGQALGGAGAGLAEKLASLGQQRQESGLGLFGQLSGQGLGTQATQPFFQQGQEGQIGNIISLITKILPLLL